MNEKPGSENVRIFECVYYALRLSCGSKFKARAVEGSYVGKANHGTLQVLVRSNGNDKLFESRYRKFDGHRFIEAEELRTIVDQNQSFYNSFPDFGDSRNKS